MKATRRPVVGVISPFSVVTIKVELPIQHDETPIVLTRIPGSVKVLDVRDDQFAIENMLGTPAGYIAAVIPKTTVALLSQPFPVAVKRLLTHFGRKFVVARLANIVSAMKGERDV